MTTRDPLTAGYKSMPQVCSAEERSTSRELQAVDEGELSRSTSTRKLTASEPVAQRAATLGKLLPANECRTYRLDKIMGETGADESTSSFLYRRSEVMLTPERAMQRLLGHVRFDVDGGILNLHNDNLVVDNRAQEVTKIPMLKKNSCEISVAFFTVLRVMLNCCGIIVEGRSALMHYICGTALSARMTAIDGHWSLHLPLLELFVTVKVLETLFVCAMGLTIIWDTVCIWLSDLPYPFLRSQCNQRYHRLVRIWWHIYPELQNFSALRTLEYIHPALMPKHATEAMAPRHAVARCVLEQFLMMEPDTATDEEIMDMVGSVLIKCEHQSASRQTRYELASEFLHMSMSQMVSAIFSCRALRTLSPQESKELYGVDVGALDLEWRVRLYTVCLAIWFGLKVVACALIGWLSFFVKLSFIAIVLSDPESSFASAGLPMLVFLNQMVGYVSLRQLLISRVRAFAFGGTDAHVSVEENYLLNVYLAILAEKVWASTALGCFQKTAVMIQFDDRDLQELMVEEDPVVKSDIVLSVRQHMLETGLSAPSKFLEWMRWTRPADGDKQSV